jgi:hypothetical protein
MVLPRCHIGMDSQSTRQRSPGVRQCDRRADRLRCLTALAKLVQSSGSPANRAATLLIACSGTGQKERALELLQQMYAEHSNAVVQIKVDPMFDPLRSDPRFKDLLLRLRLERQEHGQ